MIPKFRAWEKAGKRMVLVGSVDFRNEFIEYTYSPYDDSNRVVSEFLEFCDVVLMQSTGLFDKNGKEIFEGDVIVAMSQGVKATGEVKRRIDGYWLMYPSFQNREFWHIVENVDTGETGVEIIGDIYRNPELLEE